MSERLNTRDPEHQPYRPPRVDANEYTVSPQKETRTPLRAALAISAVAWLIPATVAGFVELGFLSVHWNSILLPAGTVLAGLLSAIVGLGLSIGAYIKSRRWMSIVSIVLALIAFPWVLFVGYLLAMAGLATHPV